MTIARAASGAISAARIVAIARVRITRVMRTRIGIVALLLVLPPWLLIESPTLLARMSALAEFSLAGLTAIGAGAVADDLDSGEYAIALTHGTTPLEFLAGTAVASFVLTSLLVAIQLPIALARPGAGQPIPILLCIAWLGALLAGWLGLMLLLATCLEGKANALAMVALFVIVPLALSPALLGKLPATVGALLRGALQLVPQLDHARAIFRALLYRSPRPALAPAILLASPIVYFALAWLRLRHAEPAGRVIQ